MTRLDILFLHQPLRTLEAVLPFGRDGVVRRARRWLRAEDRQERNR